MYSLDIAFSIVPTILLILPSYILSVHAQLVYMDEVVEVKISKGSSAISNTQFYAPPEVQVTAHGTVSNGPMVAICTHTVTQGKPSEGGNSTGFNSGPIQPPGASRALF